MSVFVSWLNRMEVLRISRMGQQQQNVARHTWRRDPADLITDRANMLTAGLNRRHVKGRDMAGWDKRGIGRFDSLDK